MPAAYDALSTPAAVFESPRSSEYSGSSGAIAAKNIVSTRITAATRMNSRRIRRR